MGITSLVGMLVALGAIVYGIVILGGELGDFYSLPSIMLVVVPTIGAIVATYPLSILLKVPAHAKAILGKGYKPEDYVEKIVALAMKARSEGLLALENEKPDDPTMHYALRMIVDSMAATEVKNSLEDSLAGITARHNEAIALYEKAAAYAPAFGMCATVISLVNMLMGLNFEDPNAMTSLGINMATALITTFYGSVLANVVFLPIAARLKILHKRELLCKTMICNGLLAIQRGDNPNAIREYLLEQISRDAAKGAAAGGGDKE